ncbi:UDP-N-acetylmuramoyl-tripeptide--D-alanyl-D-alanine ligase [Brevibacterium sp. 5221]|uniref:UDP-N-acetylmuramoyl-tripeptide--D-alanyl-D-alanine ligase n=1 Tax=Brevibacterium rongguiense TaxID=2695267 RepID=A0A6N9H9Y5_9MICO|nr:MULTISPECIES: UDP-N-acetylmuramoyl-tripeptide--D-alanyl-D-alanine ligase [Brevibacterium]MYM20344.1 UDP-N-acetylmuramoyl-tripeptide--D-alanyl-D-alanine ligase [Brevibacterium rongguiense]WAL41087.1 UDP-N-acetylmuramoyl-tripeptide--D-alanyl-D-alanine ligase [Brevibacterium sp. BRM-1]
MKNFSAQEAAAALKGDLYAIDPATRLAGSVVTDSREVAPGDVYVARRGESADGLDFAPAAVAAGAVLVISEAVPVVDGEQLPSLVVPDATAALGQLARLNVEALRAEGDLTVIAITGSAGKTTVKDLTADLLSAAGETIWPPNSYNNEVGVPLTALRAGPETRFLVLEMGARTMGNLAYLTSLVRPDIGVELVVGTAHSGVFGSIENTARAKSELVAALTEGGRAVLNADDPRVAAMTDVLAPGVETLWFSASGETDRTPAVRATDVTTRASGRTSFTLHLPGAEPAPIELALLGEHHVANALAASAVAHLCGVPAKAIATTLQISGAQSRWRMELIDSPSGVTVLNDAYNANPDSMRAALKALAAMGRGDGESAPRRTVAVLGEMLELGEDSIALHDEVGRLVVRLNISLTIAVGEGAKPIYQAANLEGSWGNEAAWVPTVSEARDMLNSELKPGDIVLFKSSRDAGLRYLGDEIAGVSGVQ